MTNYLIGRSINKYLDELEDKDFGDEFESKVALGEIEITEAMQTAFSDSGNERFERRLAKYLRDSNIDCFKNHFHKYTFLKHYKSIPQATSRDLAALYLICSDKEIFQKYRNIVLLGNDSYCLSKSKPSRERYVLYAAAIDIYQYSEHISMFDLADPKVIESEFFGLIVKAMMIARFGVGAIGIVEGGD